jgi:hypothetical protein
MQWVVKFHNYKLYMDLAILAKRTQKGFCYLLLGDQPRRRGSAL